MPALARLLPPLAICLSLGAAAAAEDPPTIGVAAPLSGPAALLGGQVAAGARAAAGGRARLVEADTGCGREGGRAAAERFAAERVRAVVGFLCADALEAALPVLTAAGIPVLAVGVRAGRFTDERARTKALLWRLGPRSDAEVPALVRALGERWTGPAPFALVDDGTSDARALADSLRAALEAAGRPPAATGTLRSGAPNQSALLARLAPSGARRLLVVATAADAAVLARDAAAAGSPVELIGPESLIDEGPAEGAPILPDGTLAIGPRDFYPADDPATPGAATDPAAAGYNAAAAAATEAALAAIEAAGAGGDIAARLNGSTFPTRLGALSFDAKGDSRVDPFVLLAMRDGRFQPAGPAAESAR